MARQIIVLDAVQEPTGVNLTISFVCWLTAPTSRTIPLPVFTSRVPTTAYRSPCPGSQRPHARLLYRRGLLRFKTHSQIRFSPPYTSWALRSMARLGPRDPSA